MTLKEGSEKRIMVIDNQLSKNLSILMSVNKITESELARALKLPYNTIKRLVSGFTTDPRISTLSSISNYFKISIDALLGTGDPTKISIKNHDDTHRSVPILSWEDISTPNFLEHSDFVNWEFWQPVALAPLDRLSETAFAIESRPSMQSRFPIGTFFIIDPKISPIDSDLVLVRFRNNDSVSLRDLIIDSPHWQLVSIVQNSPSINYNVDEHEIIGVVVLIILKTRKTQ
jgi:transcriptional regulator with XRE-family HTH domain